MGRAFCVVSVGTHLLPRVDDLPGRSRRDLRSVAWRTHGVDWNNRRTGRSGPYALEGRAEEKSHCVVYRVHTRLVCLVSWDMAHADRPFLNTKPKQQRSGILQSVILGPGGAKSIVH